MGKCLLLQGPGYSKILMQGERDMEAGGTRECVQILWSNWMTKEKTHWTERLDSPPFKVSYGFNDMEMSISLHQLQGEVRMSISLL